VVAAGIAAGSVLASLALWLVIGLGEAALLEWGWRVPFLVGGLLALAGITLRLMVRESPAHAALREHGQVERAPVRAVLRRHPRTIALIVASYIGGSTFFYGVVLFTQTYGTVALGLSRAELAPLLGVASAATIIGALFAGRMGDRVGHQKVVLISLGVCLAALPAWLVLMNSGSYPLIVTAHAVTGLATGLNFGLLGALYSRCFPAPVRYTGTGLAYNLGTVIGGSGTLIAAALLTSTGSVWAVLAYAAALLVVSLIATRALRPLDVQVPA
jgi:MFS family permease